MCEANYVYTPDTLVIDRFVNTKNTNAANGGQRHFIEWAQVLLKISATWLSKGLDPACWYGYRTRCWVALRDLEKYAAADPAILQVLTHAAKCTLNFAYDPIDILDNLKVGLSRG